MEVTLAVEAHHPAEHVRSLREWLLTEHALRGRVGSWSLR